MNRLAIALVASTFASVFLPLLVVMIGAKRGEAAQARARARRIADAQMNARLLRLNL